MTAFPDSWTEVCRVSILVESGTEYQYAALTEDITGLDFGDKDIEVVPTVSGGRIVKQTPQGEETVTLKVYPIKANIDGNGVVQLFHPQNSEDSTEPILVKNTRNRNKHRLIFLWAVSLPTNASDIPTGGPALRVQIVNAWMTRYVPSYDGKTLTAEVTFKWAPFNKSGDENKREESTNDTTTLPAASATATTLGP